WICLFFFFFQAEDGIRDYKVTGVQTCALPISTSPRPRPRLPPVTMTLLSFILMIMLHSPDEEKTIEPPEKSQALSPVGRQSLRRSEERRVGKECRARGGGEA